MCAMVLKRPGSPLELLRIQVPWPHAGQPLLRMTACGICRNDFRIVNEALAALRGGRLEGAGAQVVDELSDLLAASNRLH
jgi:propanol-preferring alcohol dehydrogenase